MAVSPISANIISALANQTNPSGAASANESAATNFADIFNGLINSVEQTDAVDEVSLVQLMTNEADSLSNLMIDAQKAELSLNLALQIRNKVLDAYKEIMSMQI